MFIETPSFPTHIAGGSSGGPGFSTSVVMASSGYETRNINWQYARCRFNAATGIKTSDDLDAFIRFFRVAQGRAHGFRFKDWTDYSSGITGEAVTPTDQVIGTGDGSTVAFPLVKAYTVGAVTYSRPIVKPVSGSVRVALDATEQLSGWSVDTTTGIVTFDTAPTASVEITAGFEFDVPCRFDIDELAVQLEQYYYGSSDIPIIEIKL